MPLGLVVLLESAAFVPLLVPLSNAPVMAEKVPGVIVPGGAPPAPVAELFWLVTMAMKAAVLGDGGGNDVGPPMSGVSPVRLTSGVSPVRMTSKLDPGPLITPWWVPEAPLGCAEAGEYWAGPASIAGERGPARRLFTSADPPLPKPQEKSPGAEGEAMDAIGGNFGFDSGPSRDVGRIRGEGGANAGMVGDVCG